MCYVELVGKDGQLEENTPDIPTHCIDEGSEFH